MKRPLANVGTLMIVVVAAALDLVAGRALLHRDDFYAYNLEILLSLAPTGVALQAALLCAIKVTGPRRAFWVGFAVSAVASLAIVVSAYADPPRETGTLASSMDGQVSTGVPTTTEYSGCIAARVVFGYKSLLAEWFDQFGYTFMSLANLAFEACSGLVPHLILACGIGYVSLALSQRIIRRRSHSLADLGRSGAN